MLAKRESLGWRGLENGDYPLFGPTRLRLRPTRHVAAPSLPQRRKGPKGGAKKSREVFSALPRRPLRLCGERNLTHLRQVWCFKRSRPLPIEEQTEARREAAQAERGAQREIVGLVLKNQLPFSGRDQNAHQGVIRAVDAQRGVAGAGAPAREVWHGEAQQRARWSDL